MFDVLSIATPELCFEVALFEKSAIGEYRKDCNAEHAQQPASGYERHAKKEQCETRVKWTDPLQFGPRLRRDHATKPVAPIPIAIPNH